jgi:hypothetical protein
MHTHNPRRGTASACTRHCLHIHIPVRIPSAVSTLTVYIHAYVCVSCAPLNTCTHTSMSTVYICTYVCVLLAPPRARSRCKSAVAGAQDSEPKFAPEVRAVFGDVYINEASNSVGDGVSGLGSARRSAAIFRMLYSTLFVSLSMSCEKRVLGASRESERVYEYGNACVYKHGRVYKHMFVNGRANAHTHTHTPAPGKRACLVHTCRRIQPKREAK